jgi:hypothetical protein
MGRVLHKETYPDGGYRWIFLDRRHLVSVPPPPPVPGPIVPSELDWATDDPERDWPKDQVVLPIAVMPDRPGAARPPVPAFTPDGKRGFAMDLPPWIVSRAAGGTPRVGEFRAGPRDVPAPPRAVSGALCLRWRAYFTELAAFGAVIGSLLGELSPTGAESLFTYPPRDSVQNWPKRPVWTVPRRKQAARVAVACARKLYELEGWDRVRQVYPDAMPIACACGRDGAIRPDPRVDKLNRKLARLHPGCRAVDPPPVAICDRCLEMYL